ncbi:MAG: hypothetical protein SFU98_20890 [Leptospiraceae bacterium]|nr:hypothetical protein [Leptospiraceae bacterium]
MRWISKFIIILFLVTGLFAEEEEEEEYNRKFEIGARMGSGYHPKDKFENDLGTYRSLNNTFTPSFTNLSPFRKTTNTEFFARVRWSDRWKGGVLFGNTGFENFRLEEIDQALAYSKLNFRMDTDFLLLTVYYEWKFNKYFIDFGGGMGVNNTGIKTNGYIISARNSIYEQEGTLVGNGLAYRLESSLSRSITENILLQVGVSGSVVTAPYFSGSLNGESGSFYIRADGTVAGLNQAEFTSSLASTNFASRRLDMVYGYGQIFVGTVYRFGF